MRTPVGESSMSISLLTPDFGLVRARAQNVRGMSAKLAPALQTLSQCEGMIVQGKEGWRLSGAISLKNWFFDLSLTARPRAARVALLILRLVPGETKDPALFEAFRQFLDVLTTCSVEDQDLAECLCVLSILHTLGFDAGEVPAFGADALGFVRENRQNIVMRINNGITASGL